jgi:hypothetical protein
VWRIGPKWLFNPSVHVFGLGCRREKSAKLFNTLWENKERRCGNNRS